MSSKITLKPLDDGQRPVEIPVGKTTIGRGPFLGCSDKKVSRNHAVLEVTAKGEVFLTPTHVNPCFYQPTAESPGQILKKDIPHKLENGDTFSLLPRAFRYQLIVQGDKDQEKTDQKELSKAKTNGSTGKCDAILNERNKDPKKGISNEELNDGNTVTEKPFSKDDHILSDTNKNCSKEENSLAKKSAPEEEDDEEDEEEEEEEDSKSPSAKTSNEDFEKEKPETNSISEKGDKQESDKESGDKKDSKDDSHDNDESCAEDKTECDKPKFSEKIVEENESTLGNDTFAKDKTDSVQSSEKVESKEKSDDKKTDVSASNGDENLDSNLDLLLQIPVTTTEEMDIYFVVGGSNEDMHEACEKIKEMVTAVAEGNIKETFNQDQEITILATPYNENERCEIRSSVVGKKKHNKSKLFHLDSNLEESGMEKDNSDCEVVEENGKENGLYEVEDEKENDLYIVEDDEKENDLYIVEDDEKENDLYEIVDEKKNMLCEADNDTKGNSLCEAEEENKKESSLCEVGENEKENSLCEAKENEKENSLCEAEKNEKENSLCEAEENEKESSLCEAEQGMKNDNCKNGSTFLENETVVENKNIDTNIKLLDKENKVCESAQNDEKYIIEDIVDIASDENDAAAKEIALFENGDVLCESRHSSEISGKDDEWSFQQEIQDIINEETEKVCQIERSQVEKESQNHDEMCQELKSSTEGAGESHEKNPDSHEAQQESDKNADQAESEEQGATITANNVLLKEKVVFNQAGENMDETDEEIVLADKQKTDLWQIEPCIDAINDISSPLAPATKVLKSRKRKFSEVEGDVNMRELVETNKKIAENLRDIGKEVKRRNDLLEEANRLQERVIRIKEKKLKLMYATANVKDD